MEKMEMKNSEEKVILSDADAREKAREARRRKILENSNNRLGKITGRVHDEEIPSVKPSVSVPNGVFYPDPEIERDVYQAPQTSDMMMMGIQDNQDIFELFKTMQQSQGAGGMPPLFAQQNAAPSNQIPETPVSKFIRSKIPIILIALIVYMLFAFSMDFLVGSAVFSSLIVWELFEFAMTTFVIKQPVQPGGLVNLLFMFGGINQRITRIIMNVLGLFNKIIKDIAIFMFTFVITHLFWSYLVTGESLQQILDKDFSNLLSRDEL